MPEWRTLIPAALHRTIARSPSRPLDRDEPAGFVTVIIDHKPVRTGTGPAKMLDMIPGRSKAAFKAWLTQRPQAGREAVEVLNDKQAARLTALFAIDEHVEVEATWGIYQRMIAAHRHPDPAASREPLMSS